MNRSNLVADVVAVPEKLHLLYPKVLSGRFELSSELRANVEVNDARVFVQERHIDLDEVKQIVGLTLRLEALCGPQAAAHAHHHAQHPEGLTSGQVTPHPPAGGAHTPHHHSHLAPHANLLTAEMVAAPSKRLRARFMPPAHLGPQIRDDMSDEELAVILESLTTRMENSLSTLVSDQIVAVNRLGALTSQVLETARRLLKRACCAGASD